MTGNKTITATFSRIQYTLNVGVVGQGSVTKEVTDPDKTSEEYNSGDVVRLTATPESEWVFNSWSGSSTATTNEIDVAIDGTKSVTATFEEQISNVLQDGVFAGVGKWKIRRTLASSLKQSNDECSVSEIIFRTDGSFTIVTGTTTVTGQFNIDSNTTISLTQSQSPFGTITNLVLTNGFISFSIELSSGCTEDADGDKDETYDEATDTSLPPVISLIGSSTINLTVGETFTDPGAIAEDSIDGDLTASITSSGTVDTSTTGTYTIEYSVSDAAGNITSVTRVVVVNLDLPPTITLTGSSIVNLLVGETYTEDGCVATDQEDGNITASITTSGTVDVSNTGTYTLVYSVSDSGNNFVSVTRTVIVSSIPDTTPPVITLNGPSTLLITMGDNWTDPGATASDNVDGDLTSSITSSGTIDTSTTGSYTLIYSVSDTAGNTASVIRTLIVSLDLPPTITLTGSSTITLLVGDTYIEDGCIATDEVDGDLTSSIITTGTVDTSTVGTYTLVYSVSDTGNNTASVTRTIAVKTPPDNTAPIIILTGEASINLTVGDTFTDPGATASDNVDGNITSAITTSGTVNTSSTGTYTISYSVSDAAGNAATLVQRTVIVSAATNSSNCTISAQNAGGGQSQTVTLTYAISDIIFSVNSSCQENLQEEVIGLPTGVTMNFSNNTAIISGTPTGQTGAYSYVANWYSSTSSFTLGGIITVVAGSTSSTSTTSSSTADTTPPVITLTGSSTINLTVGDTFTDPGATATDDVDGNLTSSITTTGTVNTSTAGTYMMYYYVSDAAGNASTEVQRTVIVNAAVSNSGNIYFDNGTCKCPNATVGDTDVINGVTYTAVNNSTIGGQANNGNINLCTTLVNSMQNLFSGKANFNSDIGFWDTSNVTNMDRLFENASSFNQDLTGWCVSNITTEPTNFSFNSSLSNANKPVWGTCPYYNINVTASSNSNYTLSGSDRNGAVSGNDPSITINVGDEVNFIVDAASHPFYIKTVQGTGTDNQVSNVTNNGATSGVVNWTPTTAGTYYYQCSAHDGMYGTITVQ